MELKFEDGQQIVTLDPPQKEYKPPTPRKGDRVALVVQGRGEFRRFVDRYKNNGRFSAPVCTVAGSFDPEQAEKNKALGYW